MFRYVAIISGLNFGDENQDCLQLQMFIDLLTGQLGSTQVKTVTPASWVVVTFQETIAGARFSGYLTSRNSFY